MNSKKGLHKPNKRKAQQNEKGQKYPSAPPSAKPLRGTKNRKRYPSPNPDEQGAQAILADVRKMTIGREIWSWRTQIVHWSANHLATELGIKRSSLKKIESRNKPRLPSLRIVKRFEELKKTVTPTQPTGQHLVTIFSKFQLPDKIKNLVKPRRCRGHQRLVLFPQETQVYCNGECKRLWRKIERRMKRDEMDRPKCY